LAAAAVLFVAAASAVSGQGLSERITERGYELPMPWGISLELYNQTQPYGIVDLQVSLGGLDISAAEGLEIQNSLDSYHLKFDYWVLPFLNIYALAGHIDGTTTVGLSDVDLGLPIILNDIRVDYSGFMYGGGATLAVGGKRWFSSLSYDGTWTDLDVQTSTVRAYVVTPNIGLNFERAQIWVGAMYQKAEESHEGVWEMPFLGAIPYSIELEQAEAWNYHLGLRGEISKHWNLVLKGGFGKRKMVLTHLEYRFGSR
jgi:hypothetical protein